MRFSNPIAPLIILVLLNALLLLPVCLSAKAQAKQEDEKLRILLFCLLDFSASAAIACILGQKLISAYVEPIEVSASKILAADQSGESKSEKSQSIVELTDSLITSLETSRQRERLIADYSSDILCCLDENRRFLDLNIQSESVWEYPIISLLATPLDSLIYSQDKDEYLQYFEQVKLLQTPEKALECRISSRSGKVIDLEWQVEWSPSSKHFYCLSKNISDRKENQRLKAEITAMVGHDLRAPVSSLSFLLDNLRSGTFGELPEEAREKLERAGDNVSQMLKLINQLLDAEKLEGGKLEADLKIIPLSEVYDNCRDLLGDLAEKRGIVLNFPPESERIALADYDRTLQILCNLVSNAIKWSPQNSSIEITEDMDHKLIRITVKDEGPGIAPEHQEAVFERFKSLDQRSDKSLASSGLGLYIAKKLVELQGGSIKLESQIGIGSRFSFTIRQANRKDLPGYID